jgi:hypothetical protein
MTPALNYNVQEDMYSVQGGAESVSDRLGIFGSLSGLPMPFSEKKKIPKGFVCEQKIYCYYYSDKENLTYTYTNVDTLSLLICKLYCNCNYRLKIYNMLAISVKKRTTFIAFYTKFHEVASGIDLAITFCYNPDFL